MLYEVITIKRGGQVYFLHNEVETIDSMGRELAAIVPEARIGIAHGQMRERELEQVMSDFYHKRFNVLVRITSYNVCYTKLLRPIRARRSLPTGGGPAAWR